MDFRVYWLDEAKHILVYEFPKQWDSNTILTMFHHAQRELEHIRHDVFSIFDFSRDESTNIPANLYSLSRYVLETRPENLRHTFIVHPNRMLRASLEISSKIFPPLYENISIVTSIRAAMERCVAARQRI